MDLNELKKEAYETARAHGWHDEKHSDEHCLMLIVTEIAEAVQADRKGKYAQRRMFEINAYTPQPHPEQHWMFIFEKFIKGSLEEELADIVIRCLDLAGLREIELPPVKVGHSNIRMDFTEFCFNTVHVAAMTKVPLKERLENIIERIFVYCESKNIDIEWFITQKMNYNRLRGYKHGGKKY